MSQDIRSFINQVLRERPGDILVVDDDIDVFNDAEVLWAIGTRCYLEKDLTVIPRWSGPGGLNPVGYEYHADGTKTPVMTAALIVDAN